VSGYNSPITGTLATLHLAPACFSRLPIISSDALSTIPLPIERPECSRWARLIRVVCLVKYVVSPPVVAWHAAVGPAPDVPLIVSQRPRQPSPAIRRRVSRHHAVATGPAPWVARRGCRKGIAARVVAGGGGYVLPAKDDRPRPHRDIDARFVAALEPDLTGLGWGIARTGEANRGRQGMR